MKVQEQIPHPLWRVTLGFRKKLGGETAEALSSAVEDSVHSVFLHNQEATDGDNWTIELTTYGEPDLDALFQRLKDAASALNLGDILARGDLFAERLPEKDWLMHVHENFPPVTVGRFFIYGSHYTGERPANLVPLQIDAATAFGSGEHATTQGCLLALQELAGYKDFAPRRVLDMGCGSGILAIAMQKLWPGITAEAVDIDPESVTVTRRHASMNGADLTAEAGDGYNAPLVRDGKGDYDIIAANILAGPLVAMAGDLARVLKPGGYAVLSGLLARQAEEVLAAHAAQGLKPVRREEKGEWRALLLQKPPSGV